MSRIVETRAAVLTIYSAGAGFGLRVDLSSGPGASCLNADDCRALARELETIALELERSNATDDELEQLPLC